MKITIEVDSYVLEHCKRHVKEHYANNIEEAVANGVPLEDTLNVVLDKIRAEIEELKPNNPNFKGYFEQNVALNKVLEIIDKYKESEVEE